ncbi:MAG: beta-ketoacyl-[acyl-carrier-protein] synthase family protein [bacterium]
MKRRAVITGIGPVTAIGIGKDAFFKNLYTHTMCCKKIPDTLKERYNYKSTHYVPFPDLYFPEYGMSPSLTKMMGKNTLSALVGAKLALLDAGYEIKEVNSKFFTDGLDDECSVIIGVGLSELQVAFHSYVSHLHKGDAHNDKNLKSFNRMVIPIIMPNALSAWISILFGLHGVNYTINASCASGTMAVGEAYEAIVNGRQKVVLAGGAECLEDDSGSIMRGFDVLSVLTHAHDGSPMPFSKNRSGFLFSEGASCMLVLEELEHAQIRKAQIYAEIIDYKANSDASHIVHMDRTGKSLKKLLRSIVKDYTIDYVNTHGTGTILNDDVEALIIKEIFGSRSTQPYLNSTKGILGHSIGASGAIEIAVTAYSIKESRIHGNIIDNPMEDLNLVDTSINSDIHYALSSSFGFGGHNAAVLLTRYE